MDDGLYLSNKEAALMRRRKKYYYINLTREELRILREAMLWFRNQVIQQGGPTEDIDGLLLRILK